MSRVLHGMPLSSLPDAGTVKDEDQMVAYRSEDGKAYRTSVSDLIMGDYLDKVYPVGSIYMSVNPTSPENLFGGEWQQIQDRFLLAAGNSHSQGETGGSETVTLTSSQIPSHTHSLPSHTHSLPSHTHSFSATTGSSGSHTHNIHAAYRAASGSAVYTPAPSTSYDSDWTTACTSAGSHTHSVSGTTGSASGTSGSASGTSGSTGSGSSHENMPPYLAVYMWQRVA